MRFFTPPSLLRYLYPETLHRKFDSAQKKLFLTFDDGPHPDVTPEILDLLAARNANAGFFCLGKNAEKHPAILDQIAARGHTLGNHTHSHLNGWKTPAIKYVEDYERCGQFVPSTFFRPPYGRITPAQIRSIAPRSRIVMWSLMSYDFDSAISPEAILRNMEKHMHNGAVIVFHDSEKAAKNCLKVLPAFLEKYSSEGYAFESLHNAWCANKRA